MENDLVKEIVSMMPTFSKSQKKIAEAILHNYNETAYITASHLGAMVGVSESTVVRFAYELGYDGYPEFQRALQKHVCVKMTPNQRIIATERRIADGDVLKSVMTSDAEKIMYTLEHIDRQAFSEAVSAILGAKRIYILGARSSATLASFFSFNLGMILDNVKPVQSTSTSELFEQLLDIGEGDLLFAISFPRYSKKIIAAVSYAEEQGATVVSLTDSAHSPIAAKADYLLTAQSDMASFVDSLTAPLSIINAIFVAITQGRKDEITDRFDKLEKVWDKYDVYAKQ